MNKGKLTIGRSVLYGELDYPVITGEDKTAGWYNLPTSWSYGTIDFIIEGGTILTLNWDEGGNGWTFEQDNHV